MTINANVQPLQSKDAVVDAPGASRNGVYDGSEVPFAFFREAAGNDRDVGFSRQLMTSQERMLDDGRARKCGIWSVKEILWTG